MTGLVIITCCVVALAYVCYLVISFSLKERQVERQRQELFEEIEANAMRWFDQQK